MISVLTASVRPSALEAVRASLAAQVYRDFEWLVCASFEYAACDQCLPEPAARPRDFYNLTKAWNALARAARGDLLVFWCDATWSGTHTLDTLAARFEQCPTALVGGVGLQVTDGRRVVTSVDRRLPLVGQCVDPMEMEFRLASVPAAAWAAVGGFDESFDRVAAWHDKEFCFRAQRAHYSCWLDGNVFYWNERHTPHEGEAGGTWALMQTAGLLLLQMRERERRQEIAA